MKKKISSILAVSLIATNISPSINVFAGEIVKQKLENIEENAVRQAKIAPFTLSSYSNFENYNLEYKVDRNEIKSISNNGGQYSSNSIEKSIDGSLSTHWETGKPNTESFKNEVVVEFEELESIDRIAYATRQDGAKGKGFPTEFEIYSSVTGEDKDFKLMTIGSHSSTGNMLEFKFDTITAKKIKFVFKEANQNWASASEFWFYKEDNIIDKMNKIFTNESKNELSSEFDSLDKLDKFDKEASNHPLYSDIEEDIKNAKIILENTPLEFTEAKISKFISFSDERLPKYDELFKVGQDKITSIATNGGHYGSNIIEKAIDGDVNTNWHSGKTNSNSHTNEVVITLDELTKIDRVMYTSLNSRGFAQKFDIYASKTSTGETFEKVTSGESNIIKDTLEIKFNPTDVRRIKFVFKQGYENWALASEIGLYKEDVVSNKIRSMFTDGTMSKLSDEYNTIEEITNLESEVKGHPLEKDHMEAINLAKQIINNPEEVESKVLELESRGNSIKESQKRKMWNFQDWQPTGLAVKSGQKINVYVEADQGKPTPKLVFKQMDSQHNGQVVIDLVNGKNTITIPEVDSAELRPGTSKAGVLYTSNPYTPKEQGRKPKIRIEGAFDYPHYIKGLDNDEQVMRELEVYVEKLKIDSSLPDVFDIFSDKTLVNVKATYALDWYKKNAKLPSFTANKSDDVIRETMRLWGYDGSSELNSDYNFRYITMVKWLDNGGFMNAGNGITGFNQREQGAVLNVNTGWGLMHEMGHNFDTNNRTIGEVTNNILPLHFERMEKKPSNISRQNLWESKILPKVAQEDYSNNELYPENDKSLLTHLAPLWQLQLYDETFWPRFEQEFRARNIGGGDWDNKHNAWVIVASDVLKLNLVEHFARHGLYVTDETKSYVSKYPNPSKKIWYMNDNKYLNTGSDFNDNIDYSVYTELSNDKVKLTFEMDEVNMNSLLGYEILRDGKPISFTSTNSFIDKEITTGFNHEYTVVAYDNELNTSKPYKFKIQDPILTSYDNVTLGLNSEFNPLDFITATDYQGDSIANKVQVTTNNVDITKKGIYEIEYTLNHEGVTKTAITKVKVVSQVDYLSDNNWNSTETQYGTPRRNTNISGRTLGSIKTFDKGLGIHANGKITYDLSNLDYERFEALVGVDGDISPNNKSSITFKVIGDGKTLATTNVLKYEDNMVNIDVPIEGVNELIIEVNDGGNGNSSDHGVIASPKLITNNAKPKLSVKDKTYKLGDKVDFNEGIKATDAEDGDLTSKIEIVSNNFEEGKAKRFELVYKVVDSDNNEVEKKAYITVYEEYDVEKSKYGSFDNLDKYNKDFKVDVESVSNNAGHYGSSVVNRIIDNDINTHWETNKPNNDSFKNEVIFDFGEVKEIDKIAYAARKDAGGKGFANKFEIYVSNEAKGNDFVFAGAGEYNNKTTDVVEFEIDKTSARRVKFKFVEANQGFASLSEVAFYKEDILSNKIKNELFTDKTKTDITENYNTLEKVDELRNEVKNHQAYELFEEDLLRAENLINAKVPLLNIEDSTYVKLNSNFDLMSGVSASDQEDGDITSSVIVNDGGFNVNKAGEYTIDYTVKDSDNNTVSKSRNIVVFSQEANISDLNWESAVSGWKNVNKDSAVNTNNKIKLNIDGTIKDFDKGIGAATNAEIVYDLNGEYTKFSTYVGTDKNYNDNRTSIIFKVFADGKEVYTSDIIRKDSKAELIDIDVKGVKELKLVADDAGDGGNGDYASWGSPKIYKINSKPELKIEKDIAVKVGESVDNLVGDYSATDAEDGDITSNVLVSGVDKVNFNIAGKYPITYSITDLDGNKIEKVRNVSVVNMDDYKYLTDYDWKSANQSYSTAKKDTSASDNALRLTKEDGSIATYERGIGAHANSTIIYDLSDKDYQFFSSYVGVDRAMYESVASVQFEVYVDGQKEFDSGLMNSKDSQKYVEVNLAGAKELKLVVKDGGNGIGSDHATFGDSKLHFANTEILDFTELEKLLKEAKELELYMYTKSSILDIENSMKKAESILEEKSLSKEELKVFTEEFKLVLSSMELDTNKLNIKESLEKVKDISREDVVGEKHADARWSNFQIAKEALERLLVDINATSEEISVAIFMLDYSVEEILLSLKK